MFGLSFFRGEGEKKNKTTQRKGVVRHRRNGSPYVNPNELVERAGTEALLGNVSESIDDLEEDNEGNSS